MAARLETDRRRGYRSAVVGRTPWRAFGWTSATLVGAGASFALLTRCNVYTPDLLTAEGDASAESGVPYGDGVGWWSGNADGCFSAGHPTAEHRPPPSDPNVLEPFYLALRTMRLGGLDKDGRRSVTAWQDQGLDLDGTCTRSPTCDRPDDTAPLTSCKPVGAELPVDGNYCRDNTFGRLSFFATSIPEIGGKYGLNDDAFNCALCTGLYNYLIKITGYNGTANDDTVRVDVYPSPGVEPDRFINADCTNPNWRDLYLCFTADLPWLIQDTAVSGPRTGPELPPAIAYDDQAFVRDGHLVANLPRDTLFWFPGKRAPVTAFPLSLKRGVVTGRLEKAPNGTWTIADGIIAGSALGTDVIRGFRLIGFCEDDPNYEPVNRFLQQNLDILASGENDPEAPCDALSLGIAFTAGQASAGALASVDPITECEPRDAGADGEAGAR